MLNINYFNNHKSFSDLPPDEKSVEELELLILRDAAGKKPLSRKYNQQEVNIIAAKLIEKGFIRGTIVDRFNNVTWSRITPRGLKYMELIENRQ
mgnify:CR=1 FL=1